ncbi:serine protease [Myxococcus faecalis]|uniref:serine protease n=1 Tax=Myxococcus faecalis TaxID=3115646 RepID=UPI003CEA2626
MTRQAWFVVTATLGVLGCGEPAVSGRDPLEAEPQAILGGTNAAIGQFPYHVRILGRGASTCEGALVRPGWVLTTASCVSGFLPSELLLIAGEVRTDVTEPTQQSRAAQRWVPHPSFTVLGGAPVHDLAVIQTTTPFTVTSAVSPIALPSSAPALGTSHTATGWGHSGTGGPVSTQLQHASMPVHSLANCAPNIARPPVGGAELCLGIVNQARGACVGDEGAPLASNGTLYGLMSWDGTGACQQFTVFTNVASYVTWIVSYTG